MQRKWIPGLISGIIAFIIYLIQRYYEVNDMITPENSYLLLRGAIILACVCGGLFIWRYWPMIRRIQFRKPIVLKQENSAPEPLPLTFYEDRGSLTKHEGKLTTQIEKTNHVWMSCFTGSTLEQSDALGTHKITKLVLYDPSYDLLKVYAAMEGDVNKVHAYRSNIVSATKCALDHDVSVYWAKRPLINFIIANPESAKDETKWAKIETFIPYRKADERPSYIITKTGFPELYLRLIKSFNAIIENIPAESATRVACQCTRSPMVK